MIMSSDIQQIRYDRIGKPIRVPPKFKGTYEEFADLVDQLDPMDCSFPNGHTLDKVTKKPCRKCKTAFDACEDHGKTKVRKNLRYGKYLSPELGARMAEAHIDPELLNIGHNVDFFEIRLTQLMERLNTGESRDAWTRLTKAWAEMTEAKNFMSEAHQAKDDAARQKWSAVVSSLLNTIESIIMASGPNESAWDEALALTERVTRLKMLETTRRKEAGLTMNVEQALAFVQQISDIVNQEVEDKNTRATIAMRMATAIGLNRIGSGLENKRSSVTNSIHEVQKQVPKAMSVEEMIANYVE